ncbi:PQQ-binding-like beta-propeller repeat protein [Candidatus Pelagibacter sp.]|uniref:PQQ-binding-like beta-propeller repeat protein n=1 Tax=Candidatus Pelagibacter sp. TaxID=2024849 RepID=UPI003F87F812
MNKLIFTLIVLFFLSNCSFNENSRIWKDKENKLEADKKITKVFAEENLSVSEFNRDLKLDLSSIKINNKNYENQNNLGLQNYKGELTKIGNFKFSKLEELNQLDFEPIFLNNGIIFFDKKGTIIRYDNNQKVIWKKNYYSKAEKKLKPKLNFLVDSQNLLVADSIAKYYSVNISTGELNWSKNNDYPFNSNIKKHKDKIFVIDYNNTLRCFKIKDGSECWNLQTEDSFTISNIKYSLIILNDNVIFNNSIGDITAVDIETGLITWQLPTQSSSIINETYNFKTSQLVSDGNSVFFSNNKNQFYSIDLKTGTTNWINEVNSNVKPILVGNLIFTISNEGYLYLIDKNKGNIVRITDLFLNYKDKKRKNIYPIGFVIGDKNLFLTNSDGKMVIAGIEDGKTIKIEKVSSGLVSEPFIFNNNLYVVRNGSIVQYN